MKTFGEIQPGDKVYSLNYDKWGVLTEHIVTEIKRNERRTYIKVKGYLKHQLIGDTSSDKTDLELFENNKGTKGEVAPSIEGVKQHWVNEINLRIDDIKNEIEELNKYLQSKYRSLDKIQSIKW